MKKIFFIAMVLLTASLSFAQSPAPGSLSFLDDHKSLKVVVDYTQAIIDNMDYETRCESDIDWAKNEKEVTSRFLTSFSRVLASHKLTMSKSSELLFVVKVTKIDEDGECYAFAQFQDKDGIVLGTIENLNGKGGKMGSFTNLAGDGMERLATAIGIKLDKYNHATKKAAKKAAREEKKAAK